VGQLAAEKGLKQVVETLLKAGSNPDLATIFKSTPRDLADIIEIKQILRDASAYLKENRKQARKVANFPSPRPSAPFPIEDNSNENTCELT